jgi:pyruvate dehydrogenase E1 component alpha subunit
MWPIIWRRIYWWFLSFIYWYIGQEAIIAALAAVKRSTDSTITSYRDHGHILISGIEPKYVMAELTGRAQGCSKGKGGSMHMFNKEGKFFGGHGIVGAQVPLGTGLAFAEKYNKTENISFTFLGDGAINQGQVYEAFNMAALWSLPVIYIIENNEYSMGTSVARSTFMTDLHRKGESFGIPGKQVNGMDFDELYIAFKEAANYVRGGNGPTILEIKTYRYRGHSMSDPAKYRSKEEVDAKKILDPIEKMRHYLLDTRKLDENIIINIEKEIKEIIRETEEFATTGPLPEANELFTDILK